MPCPADTVYRESMGFREGAGPTALNRPVLTLPDAITACGTARPPAPWTRPPACPELHGVAKTASSLARALRRCTRADRVPALLRALGIRPITPPIGLAAPPGAARAAIVGEHGGLAAVLVEATSLDAAFIARAVRRLRAADPARPHLFVFAGKRYHQLALAVLDLDGALRQLRLERLRPLRSDLETLAEMADDAGAGGVARAHALARALDRSRLTRRFFRDFRARRADVAAAWTGLPADAGAERDRLALLLLCRLMFLYFLQRGGHLAGDRRFMAKLLTRHRREAANGTGGRTAGPAAAAGSARPDPACTSFFRARLQPLFFGALNTRPRQRTPEARRLGALPYLNGGLFERHQLERRYSRLDLPDPPCAGAIEGLLEHYRFTIREAGDPESDPPAELSVDPEMLGRVFEELMGATRRGATGTFYTPAPLVDGLVREAVAGWLEPVAAAGDAVALPAVARAALARRLKGVRVLDPACGSGAFLLGALVQLGVLRAQLEGADVEDMRRELVAHGLYGVDVQHDASLLCALRLWLALTVADGASAVPPPLPNLDRRIRQGNALLEPLEFAVGAEAGGAPWSGVAGDAGVRAALRRLAPLSARYVSVEPERRGELRAELRAAEMTLARAWLEAGERKASRAEAELRALAGERDLFGEPGRAALDAAAALERRASQDAARRQIGRDLEEAGELPFFSFGVHFAEAAARGFDLVLSNPPWVRAHRWPAGQGAFLRSRYDVCSGGWRGGTTLARVAAGVGAQVDLALLFLERSLRLLAPGGVLAMLLPAKSLRALYGAGARRLLLRGARLLAIHDHSLDARGVFHADAFPAAVVARRRQEEQPPSGDGAVRVTLERRGLEPLRFSVDAGELPLVPEDAESPWILAPPPVTAAMRRMQAAGSPLGRRFPVRRGVVTGANEILVIAAARPRLAGLASIEAEGARRAASRRRSRLSAVVESAALVPLVRGAGIRAWGWDAPDHVVWLRDDAGRPTPAPPRMARYLERHVRRLRRAGRPKHAAPGTIQRVSAHTLGPKVAWHDLAETLKAVALPARVRDPLGGIRPLIPLNTVYFAAVRDRDDGLVLAALLNATPVRTFVRAIAERAKDARFRFFAWTVAVLPLPAGLFPDRRAWSSAGGSAIRRRLLELSTAAHEAGTLTPDEAGELDALVAAAYGLSADDMSAIGGFDAWLRGCPP